MPTDSQTPPIATALKNLIGSSFDINGDGNIDNLDLLLTGSTSDDVVIGNSMVATIRLVDGRYGRRGDRFGVQLRRRHDRQDEKSSAFGIAVGIAAGGAGGVRSMSSGAGVVAFNEINGAHRGQHRRQHRERWRRRDRRSRRPGPHPVRAGRRHAVSAGGAGAVSVNVTVSVTYAENTMGGSLLATIDDSDVDTT